jgi:hypothetical protein
VDLCHEGKGDSGAQRAGYYSVPRGVHGVSERQQRNHLMVDVMRSSIFIHLKHRGTELHYLY